jgi:hypothetical protein
MDGSSLGKEEKKEKKDYINHSPSPSSPFPASESEEGMRGWMGG